jgi:hypothetical protein
MLHLERCQAEEVQAGYQQLNAEAVVELFDSGLVSAQWRLNDAPAGAVVHPTNAPSNKDAHVLCCELV